MSMKDILDIFPNPTEKEITIGTLKGSLVNAYAVVPFNNYDRDMADAMKIADAIYKALLATFPDKLASKY